MRSEKWILDQLEKLTAAGLERRTEVYPPSKATAANFSSNDYLNLSAHPAVLQAQQQATAAGSGASRLVSGTTEVHQQFEQQLAEYLDKPAAVICGAGYLANVSILTAWLRRSDTVFADRLVHASLIDGIQLSMAQHQRFRHNDLDHLEQLLTKRSANRQPDERWLVVVESIYSMDGDRAPLEAIAPLAAKFDAELLVDEAHALGVFGPAGQGVAAELGITDQVGILTGTLSKSFGSYGGIVAGSELLRRLVVNRARPFIYNTGLPPGVLLAAGESLRLMKAHPEFGPQLLALADHFRTELEKQGLTVGPSTSQIVPVMVGDNELALALAERLQTAGTFVKAIRPPTVPEGTARLRFSITLAHHEALLTSTAEQVGHEARQLGLIE
ncbi:aminotransferase class I/II-fold pyridoxal phosphate-dependent enzyme [Aeoliella mucimassa]|uniref:aminotransferase class I/II-fold pyridoxal phosphate-dependent enzyme n=1 Tax=Aeoliella mucimassa TaxID=2527972 RepID=UPI0018D43B50|nr:8-amino-7-oxononanoate synthase [Aeoliella mucimassa]